MFGWFWMAMGVGIAVLLVPYVTAIRGKVPWDQAGAGAGPGGGLRHGRSLSPHDLLSVERYPVYMGVTAFVILTTGAGMGALIYYFLAGYNGWISILYFVVETCEALTCAYLQAYIIYYVMDPARRWSTTATA